MREKKAKNLYGFEIKGENLSYMESPEFGASEFVLTTEDGKEHNIDESIAYFGSKIEPINRIQVKYTLAWIRNKNQKN